MNEYVVSSTFNYKITFKNGSTISMPYGNRGRLGPQTNEQALDCLHDHDPYELDHERRKRMDDAMRYTV